jgi:hypothetical protein
MIRIVLTAIALICLAGVATAQITPGDGLIIVNGGYSTGQVDVTDETIDGIIISATYEKLDWRKPISFGFNIGYSSMTFDTVEGTETVNREVRTFPMYVGGKGYLGKGRIQGYAGGALGLYFSSLKTTVPGVFETTVSTTGFGLGVPIGGVLSISKGVFINLNYTLNWLWSNEFIKNDLLHTFNVGIGFNLGK